MSTHPEHKCNYPPVRITIRSEGELCIEYEHAERCIENLERMRMAVEEGWYQPSELEQFAYSLLNNIPNFIKG